MQLKSYQRGQRRYRPPDVRRSVGPSSLPTTQNRSNQPTDYHSRSSAAHSFSSTGNSCSKSTRNTPMVKVLDTILSQSAYSAEIEVRSKRSTSPNSSSICRKQNTFAAAACSRRHQDGRWPAQVNQCRADWDGPRGAALRCRSHRTNLLPDELNLGCLYS